MVQLFEKPPRVLSKRKTGTLKLSFTPDFYRHRFAPHKIRAPIKIEPPHVINPNGQTNPALSAGNFSRITSIGMRCDSPDDLVVGPPNEFDEDLSATSYPALKPNLTHANTNDNFTIQDGRLSPNFRITAHLPVRAQPADPPMAAFEHMIRSGFYHRHVHTQTKRKDDTVSVTLTLTRDASSDIRRVLVGLASLLGLDGPSSLDYELRLDTPPSSPALRIKEERDDKILCKMCHVSITEQGGVKKKWSELGLKPNFEEGEEALFCSSACFKRFSCEKLAAERKMMNLSDPSTSKALLPNCHSSLDEVISFVVEGGGAKIAAAIAASAPTTQQTSTAVTSGASSLPLVQRFSKPYNGQTILEQAINARDLLTGARSIFGVVSDYSIAKSET
uniref:Uncharacterized protein n=1 Tax=Romanomermis culicivorax TaxID=13658 RepID=A0A915LBI7_ROMCU